MAKLSYVSGTFNALYIGQAAATGTPLSLITNVGTNGYRLGYDMGREKFIAATNSYVQSSAAKLDISCTFISDDPNAFIIAMGNWLGANQDDVPGGQQYSLLFLDSINTNGSSVFIPVCESVTHWDLERAKVSQTQIALQFRWQNSNSSTHLFYKRSNAAIKTLLGPASPY